MPCVSQIWWSIYCNCLHNITQIETYSGCYFITVFLIWMKLFFFMQYYGMSRHKMSFSQAFISYFITEMIGFCCICLFPRTTSDTKFYFVSLSIQSNVNRIFFMEGLNLISFKVSQKVLKTIFVIDFFTTNIFCQEII